MIYHATAGDVAYRDIVPIFVYHHDAQEHAKRKEEQPVDVMLDRIADRDAERKEKYLGDSKERRPKDDVPNRPPIGEGAKGEGELGNDVD